MPSALRGQQMHSVDSTNPQRIGAFKLIKLIFKDLSQRMTKDMQDMMICFRRLQCCHLQVCEWHLVSRQKRKNLRKKIILGMWKKSRCQRPNKNPVKQALCLGSLLEMIPSSSDNPEKKSKQVSKDSETWTTCEPSSVLEQPICQED